MAWEEEGFSAQHESVRFMRPEGTRLGLCWCSSSPHPTKDVTLDSGEVSSQQRRGTAIFLGLPNGAQIEVTKSSLDAIGAVWAKGKAWLVAS